ncbi:MAG: deoxyribodipyrimidine photo-lyase [Woeseiaceae bacterium]|nr:deoxyribodipyrimidine photo-lyase [Woeseiaceae bacterium]
MSSAIVWFRRNLRVSDNPALTAAAESGKPIIPLYVIDDLDEGSAGRWWLHNSLQALHAALRDDGGYLVIRAGNPVDAIEQIAEDFDASDVYLAARYEPAAVQQERDLETVDGLKLHVSTDYLLNEPGTVLTGGGSPFKVFTPFYKTASAQFVPYTPAAAPADMTYVSPEPEGDRDAHQALLPTLDWADRFPDYWTPGEEGALARLEEAKTKVANYDVERDRPGHDGTSRLSPHMHFGEISAGQAHYAISSQRNAEPLIRQLYWRDFSYHLLSEHPTLPSKPLRSEFDNFPWVEDDEHLKQWQRGKTGYPIVDAGMRQLWHTGWMHNRVRMIVASFLVKHLLIPWQHGADWFLDTLLDADLANNSAGWQWVAGCGTDAAPYFRVFNPILQGQKFDPDGAYVREWVPELENMPSKFIHEPWTAPEAMQQECGVIIGRDYPEPIVEHKAARQRALDAYQLSRDLVNSAAS